VADKKIPLLTEVYQPKVTAESEFESKSRRDDVTLITPELITRIAAHIKPRLEADIARTVTESVREALKAELLQALQDEVIQTQASIEARTVDFVDKTKADLKTELPRMYQASADLVYSGLEEKIAELQTDAVSKADQMLSDGMQAAVQHASAQINVNVEALRTEVSGQIMRDINTEMTAFQSQAISNHQAQLEQALTDLLQSLNQNANANLQVQASVLQAEALAEMRANFIEAMPEIYTAVVAEQQDAFTQEISQQMFEDSQAYQAKSLALHQVQLGESLTHIFSEMNEKAKQDLQSQMSLLHTDVLSQMRATINEAIPSIYETAADELKNKFMEEMTAQALQVRDNFLVTVNADLPSVQEVMRDNIQHILATTLPELQNNLRDQLTTELEDLLLKVKFVLPQ
jgi:pheromone shutdown protein TraB